MATMVLYGNAPPTVPRAVQFSVWVYTPKTPEEAAQQVVNWWSDGDGRDNWTWLPWVRPVQATVRQLPGVDEARFEYHYGLTQRPGQPWWDIYPPEPLWGCTVAIWACNGYVDYPIWIGTIEAEEDTPDGTPDWAQGDLQFTAYGLAHTWDRAAINATYTDGGRIDEVLAGNKARRFGLGVLGNMSTEPDPISGVHVFSHSDGAEWTSFKMLEYVLQYFSPFVTVLEGNTETLDAIITEYEVGRWNTVKGAVDALISRRDAMSACLVPGVRRQSGTVEWNQTDGIVPFTLDGTMRLVWTSMLAGYVSYDDYVIPPCDQQEVLFLDGDPWIEASLEFNSLAAFDAVEVEGGRVQSVFTLSYTDGTLVKGWTDEEEAAYKAGSAKEDATDVDHDIARTADDLRRVWRRHRVRDDWNFEAGDGENGDLAPGYKQLRVIPVCLSDGTMDWGYGDPPVEAGLYAGGLGFEDRLPMTETNTDGDPENQRPFALIQHIADEGDEARWHFAHALNGVEETGADVSMQDNELAINLSYAGSAAHKFALNHWTVMDAPVDCEAATVGELVIPDEPVYPLVGHTTSDDKYWTKASAGASWVFYADGPEPAGSKVEPIIDYETALVTVCLETYTRLKVSLSRTGLPYMTTGRIIRIQDNSAQAWFVRPGTVVDLRDGTLVRIHDLETDPDIKEQVRLYGKAVRDNSDQLRRRAQFTAAYYGQACSTAELLIKDIEFGLNPGVLIVGASNPAFFAPRTIPMLDVNGNAIAATGGYFRQIGTVVTQKTYNFRDRTTSINTAFREIEGRGDTLRKKKRMQSASMAWPRPTTMEETFARSAGKHRASKE